MCDQPSPIHVFLKGRVKRIGTDIESALKAWLSGVERVVIVGVGNPLRMDDHAGVEVVKALKKKLKNSRVRLFECESVPEDFIEPITDFKPTHILLVDAALLGEKPGFLKLMNPKEIEMIPISTHTLPLSILSEYLVEETGAKVALLAIQPKETGFGEGLTEELSEAVERTASMLAGVLENLLTELKRTARG
ncbi:hydrogenase maturation peptidase HycI [Candidatus Bathyarchaeota archaeon]|nr:MAG: hydrogenase maturation peptidase HycI [Candidatus Bathyarchaeota archaeon]HDJ04495.1 hydrogenase maturation peptidase HycI [Candidatus Bathyarchaeota archaeon]